MKNALEAFENDANAYVAVLHGIGGNFCSGFDLEEITRLENETDYADIVENGLMVSNLDFKSLFSWNKMKLDFVESPKLCK